MDALNKVTVRCIFVASDLLYTCASMSGVHIILAPFCFAQEDNIIMSPELGHCVVLLSKTLYFRSASLHPGV